MAYERRGYAGGATSTTLNGGITSGSTSITIAANTGWPDGSSGTRKFAIVLDPGLASEEKVLISTRSGVTLTVDTRGYDGTTAQAHSNGATVQHVLTSIDADEANAASAATVGAVTTKGDVLIGTGTNTLARAAAPTNDQIRIADSAQTNGWANYAVPLGYLGSASTTTDQASIGTTVTDLTSLSVAVTARTSRRLKVTAQVTFTKSTTGAVALYLTDSGNSVIDSVSSTITTGEALTMSLVTFIASQTGAKTFKLRANVSAGTASTDVDAALPRKAWIAVEDVGV